MNRIARNVLGISLIVMAAAAFSGCKGGNETVGGEKDPLFKLAGPLKRYVHDKTINGSDSKHGHRKFIIEIEVDKVSPPDSAGSFHDVRCVVLSVYLTVKDESGGGDRKEVELSNIDGLQAYLDERGDYSVQHCV